MNGGKYSVSDLLLICQESRSTIGEAVVVVRGTEKAKELVQELKENLDILRKKLND